MDVKDLLSYDIFVDFGKGDKFLATVPLVDEKKKKIILHCDQGQLDWVRTDVKHPTKKIDRPAKAKKIKSFSGYYIYGRPEPKGETWPYNSDPFELIGTSSEKPNIEDWLGFKMDKKIYAEQIKVCFFNGTERVWSSLCLTRQGWCKWDDEIRKYVPITEGLPQKRER